MAKYLMRFDDINSRMNWRKFFTIKKVLEKYDIKSILGVIPKCEDKFLEVEKVYPEYYESLRRFYKYGDTIAQHGYEHLYNSKSPGFYGNSSNSEFAGNIYKNQLTKLSKGKEILKKESLWNPVFMAPNHSFDHITIKALKKLNFKIILDGFSISPFSKYNLDFIPQISSRPLPSFLPILSQLCVHINTIPEKELNQLILFIEKNHNHFIKLEDLKIKNNIFTYFDRKFISFFIRIFRLLKKFISFHSIIFFKSLCLYQRFIYYVRLRNIDIYKWHLSGTFYCRIYKMQSLEIINSLKPDLYIDIGCGLGEILSKVELPSDFKFGYDLDSRLVNAINILHKKDFMFFTNEDELFFKAKKLIFNKDQNVVLSMLGFSQDLTNESLVKKINRYFNIIGKFTLLIDNIYINSKEYRYDHHDYLYNHKGLIKYFHKVDQLRSLYCISIN
tara:strand:+ start:3384 stop:4718 length:1335 start_codon:yes stop_codon:yes gene_type:complete